MEDDLSRLPEESWLTAGPSDFDSHFIDSFAPAIPAQGHIYEPPIPTTQHLADFHDVHGLPIGRNSHTPPSRDQNDPRTPKPNRTWDTATNSPPRGGGDSFTGVNPAAPVRMAPEDQYPTQHHEHVASHGDKATDSEAYKVAGIDVPAWSGEFSTFDQASDFLATLADPLRRPEVENDDAELIRRHKMVTFGQKIVAAIVHAPDLPPSGLNEAQSTYYHNQQVKAMKKIKTDLSKSKGPKIAEARALVLIDTAILCHTEGLPAKDFEPGKQKNGYKSLTDITCSERITKIITSIQKNKVTAQDVLNGSGLQDLARNPDHFHERKLQNVKSNGNKPKVQKEIREVKEVDIQSVASGQQENDKAILEPKPRRSSQSKKTAHGIQKVDELRAAIDRKRDAAAMEEDTIDSSIDQRHVRARYEEARNNNVSSSEPGRYAEPFSGLLDDFSPPVVDNTAAYHDIVAWLESGGELYQANTDREEVDYYYGNGNGQS